LEPCPTSERAAARRRRADDQRDTTMAKFMLIYRDPAQPAAPPSPEEMQAFLGLWGEWFQKFDGKIVDGGDALKPGGRVLKAGGIVTDGAFVEVKEVIGGYSVVQADDYDGAVAIAKECPIAKFGGAIEIREFAGYN
jgi:hypothetical protein